MPNKSLKSVLYFLVMVMVSASQVSALTIGHKYHSIALAYQHKWYSQIPWLVKTHSMVGSSLTFSGVTLSILFVFMGFACGFFTRGRFVSAAVSGVLFLVVLFLFAL